MSFRFNSGNGGITCDVCCLLFCTSISPETYAIINALHSSSFDLCEQCDDSSQAPSRSAEEDNEI